MIEKNIYKKNKREINRNAVTFVLVGIGFILTVIATFFVSTPPREGNVVSKKFTPAHIQPAGETVMYVPDNWNVVVQQCSEGNDCQTGIYDVSQTTYNDTVIGDYMSFKVENSFPRWLIRGILFALGIMCLFLIFIMVEMILDDFGVLWLTLGSTVIFLCAITGYGCIFLAIKGPEGFIS